MNFLLFSQAPENQSIIYWRYIDSQSFLFQHSWRPVIYLLHIPWRVIYYIYLWIITAIFSFKWTVVSRFHNIQLAKVLDILISAATNMWRGWGYKPPREPLPFHALTSLLPPPWILTISLSVGRVMGGGCESG